MRLPKRVLYATAFVAVFASFQALSDTKSESMSAMMDTNAFDEAWTGEYYQEPEMDDEDTTSFRDFEAKRRHFLESKEIDVEEEIDDAAAGVDHSRIFPNGFPSPVPLPKPSFTPFLPIPSKRTYPWTQPSPRWWTFPTLPRPDADEIPLPTPSESPRPGSTKPQAFYYYNRGSLQNASQLEAEGRGFIKVFRERDETLGGRAWGTRAMIDTIRNTALEFSEKYPGRERIQVADIARKAGGKTNHGSHQNGLDADIVYIRKNRKEQLPFGGYGKNGFAEQFVIRGAAKRTYRDKFGKVRSIVSYSLAPSTNFDVDANFELLKMITKSASVKTLFVDKVLIRELFRYAERNNLATDVEVQSMLMRLKHAPSHADHFHLRLHCQASDTKCVSGNAVRTYKTVRPKRPS